MDALFTKITVVLVLYKVLPENSSALQSLQWLRGTDPRLDVQTIVYDNSPERHSPSQELQAEYLSDTTNPGLAVAYNTALQRAVENGSTWLLLLDQDTTLTSEYWAEAATCLLSREISEDVCALLPRLVERGHIHSPTNLPRLSHTPVTMSGLSPVTITAFNSAALLRVSALQAMGGFDPRFPLEFLDHATFHQLQARGGRVWLMRASLEHSLSTHSLGEETSTSRYRNMLQAERDFYQIYGSSADKLFYRLRRFKQAVGQAVKVPNKRFALLSARAALGLLPPTSGR